MNQTIDLLKSHTSIRNFNETAITREEETAILEAALRGASAGNMMYYSIIKIKSKETLKKLAKSCDNQPFIEKADMALLFVVDNYKWHRYFQQREIPKDFSDYEGPHLGNFMLGIQDTMIAAQNAVIAAESLGLGTCYIGDIMEHYEYHKALFNLPEYTMAAALVVIGNYDYKPQLRDRFHPDFVVFDEKYPPVEDTFVDDMFAKEEEGDKDFVHKFYKRKMDSDFFREMKRSLAMYLKEWQPKEE